MKKIVNFAISYPVTVTMMIMAILLLGKISYDRLGVDLFPSMDSPKLYVEITTTDKPPTEIESQIIERVEATAIRVDGAKHVTSNIRSNGAVITVEYLWGEDMDSAFLELQRSMTAYANNDNIEEITVSEKDPSAEPIVRLALSHKEMGVVDITRIANSYVKPRLLSVEGVADVEFTGDLTVEVVVETTPYKLAAFSLNTTTLAEKIESNNYRVSGGRIEDKGIRYLVNGSNVLESIEAFGQIIVAYSDGKAVYLKDVAEVYLTDKEPESIVRLNGEQCVGIEIFKERDFNTLKATTEVVKEVERLKRAMLQYDIIVVNNQGEFIERSIGDVQDSALLGMLLAVIVLFIFLRRVGTTIVISLAIPISIVATFNMFYFGGLTLNIMTLGGLALGAGMLVDNAIVVIENIFRKQEEGLSLKEAIVEGTSQVGGAIIASTLTTIVVFFPIVYLHGQSGELFKEQAWSVTFALVSSLFVAIIAIPVMYSKINSYKSKSKSKSKSRSVNGGESVKSGESAKGGECSSKEYSSKECSSDECSSEEYSSKECSSEEFSATANSIKLGWYGNLLRGVVAKRYLVILIALGYVSFVLYLAQGLGSEFMPSSASKSISLDIELTGGATLNRTRTTVRSIENVIAQIAGDSIDVFTRCGVEGDSGGTTPLSNMATLNIILGDKSKATAPELIEQLNEYLESIEGLKSKYSSSEDAVSSLFSNDGSDIIIEIRGKEMADLGTLQQRVIDGISGQKGIETLIYQESNGDQEISITVDRTVASVNNLTLQSVVTQVKEQLNGAEAGSMEYQGEMSDINVRLPKIPIGKIGDLEITNGEQTLLLRDIAKVEFTQAPSEIMRIDQSRVMQVGVKCNDDLALSKVADNIREVIETIDTPDGYYISLEGSERERKESFNSLMFALMLSVILVYMVMASQFESLLHPFTILLTVPLAVAGAVLLFILTGVNLNIMAAIGMVMLVGIAVNGSILLVDRIGQLRQQGNDLASAIVMAAEQRIRPILMTSITTILALMPMALSMSDGAEFQRPMAIAVIGGLVASTLLSLTVIPCLYYALEEMKQFVFRGKKEE
ncbi:MAG: efflux RND transporter permease subunit [Rikenellaceae bacterium]